MIRILYIEDSAVERVLVTSQLNRTPGVFRCQAVAGWVEALSLLDAGLAADLDLVLMDLGLPSQDGIAATRQLHGIWKHLKIVILSGDSRRASITAALSAGAVSYILKSSNYDQLVAALVSVHNGGVVFSKGVCQELIGHFHERQPLYEALSPTEKEILDRRERGQSYKRVADEMRMSIPTLKTHQERIRAKTLGAATIAEAAWLRKQAS